MYEKALSSLSYKIYYFVVNGVANFKCNISDVSRVSLNKDLF